MTGPPLPFPIGSAAIVEYQGGVLLIGGKSNDALDTIYHLPHASADWTPLAMTLSRGRFGLVAFLVPDDYTVCP